jgi:hypothetical protein
MRNLPATAAAAFAPLLLAVRVVSMVNSWFYWPNVLFLSAVFVTYWVEISNRSPFSLPITSLS